MDPNCSSVPPLLSTFIDTFVDFSISNLFFPNPNPNPNPNPPTFLPTPPRLVAVGDLHGDLPKSLSALAVAGIVDPTTLRWTAGSTLAVQIGDVLDRGGDEIRLLYLIERLKREAEGVGGRFVTVHGNHEIMNLDLDFRYVTPSALVEFENWAFWYSAGITMKSMCSGLEKPKNPFLGVPRVFPGVKSIYWDGIRSRIAALRPNGPISARFLAGNQTVVVVGDSIFAHGGLLQEHVKYGLERINEEVRDWVKGLRGSRSPSYLRGRNSVVWLRRFSDPANYDCDHLVKVLGLIPGAARMVMGHTIQTEGINAVCGGQAVRIDVGLSKGCGDGLPEVLEIREGEGMRVLTANPRSWVRKEKFGERKGLAVLVSDNQMKEVEVKA